LVTQAPEKAQLTFSLVIVVIMTNGAPIARRLG